MIVVQTYTKNAEQFSGITSAIEFEGCKRRKTVPKIIPIK